MFPTSARRVLGSRVQDLEKLINKDMEKFCSIFQSAINPGGDISEHSHKFVSEKNANIPRYPMNQTAAFRPGTCPAEDGIKTSPYAQPLFRPHANSSMLCSPFKSQTLSVSSAHGPSPQSSLSSSSSSSFHTSTPVESAKKRDYYEVLGVDRNADAGQIKKAYYSLAKKWHPDANRDNKDVAEEKFQEVQRAYECLGDKEKRQVYDQVGPEGMDQYEQGGGAGGFHQQEVNMDDIFEHFFGGQFARAARRGPDAQVGLTISFMDAMTGGSRTLNVNGRNVDINIPKGVDTGVRLRVNGEGGKAKEGSGLPRGNLYVHIEVVPDPRFVRQDNDLHVQADLGIHHAALGTVIKVPTLFDGEASLKVRPGTQSGHQIRMRGKGVPSMFDNDSGDLYVHCNVIIPKQMTDRQKKLLEEFGEEEDIRTGKKERKMEEVKEEKEAA